MKNLYRKFLFIFLVSVTLAVPLFGQPVSFTTVTCNSQTNPIAVESQNPLFSWIVDASGFDREQTAYQILVATSKELLTDESADMWNSGRVGSSQSVGIEYKGKELKPMAQYYWKIRIWDEDNALSGWSSVQLFQMGLMDLSNWGNAKWICLHHDSRSSEYRFRDYKTGPMKEAVQVTSHPVGYFRKKISIGNHIRQAMAYICGLGYYELFLNGEKVGDHVLDPAPSNYDKLAYYTVYDITKELNNGANVVGIVLGNGFYGQNICWKKNPNSPKDMSYGIPAVRLKIRIVLDNGRVEEYYTDQSWKNTTGPIVFDNVYGGDTYDARYEIGKWNQVMYDDSKWENAKLISPNIKTLRAQQMAPIRTLDELSPTNIFKSSTGNWIVDFGQNIAGWVQIKVQQKRGDVIRMIPTEALTKNGTDVFPGSTGGGANGLKQSLVYICKGDGIETWQQKFSYMGFRYVEISGLSSKPTKESIVAKLVATDLKRNGDFYCSDTLLNKMDTVSRWTITDNIHGIPEDCPHREKCGWLGDSYAYCEYAMSNYDMNLFYKKYMEDIRTQLQLVKGGDSSNEKFHVSTMIAPGKRTSGIAKLDWGIATIYLPWYHYRYYGDKSIIRDYYKYMKELTNYYLSFKDDKGIIQNGMGDWCPPRWDRRRNPAAMECDPIISANAYFFDILKIMKCFAGICGDVSFEQKINNQKKALYQAFNKQFLKSIPNTKYKWYGSQTATVMALRFELVPKDVLRNVVLGLEYDINVAKKGHISTGIHGSRFIYSVLSEYGLSDLAYELLTVPTFPSQHYVLNCGFTTWPERQFEWDKMDKVSNSLNHPMNSGFAAYFFECLGGIKPILNAPGYREFVVNPMYPHEISHATVNMPTPYGIIHNSWVTDGDRFNMDLHVPFNTTAHVVLPTNSGLESLAINGTDWKKYKSNHVVHVVQQSILLLKSGTYHISYVK